jgi:hypothetical protein
MRDGGRSGDAGSVLDPTAAGGAGGGLRFSSQVPEPGRFWIAHAPRVWGWAEGPWCDLAAGRVVRRGRGAPPGPQPGAVPAARFDDVVYLPPVAAAWAAERDALAARLVAAGTPLVVQVRLSGEDSGGLFGSRPGAARGESAASWLARLAPPARSVPSGPPAPPGSPMKGARRSRRAGAEEGAAAAAAAPPASPSSAVSMTASRPAGEAAGALPEPAPLSREELIAELSRMASRALATGSEMAAEQRRSLPAEPEPSGAVVVMDLLPALLTVEPRRWDALLPGEGWEGVEAAVFPLVPGISDAPALWERVCRRLSLAGVRCVQAMVPALQAGDRRWLAEGRDEAAFEGLYHHGAPVERDFARVAHRHGLAPFLQRPLPRPPLPRGENRRLGGLLALAGELWLRVGRRPVEQAQALFRAARWCDAASHDVAALRRDGNLGVVTALDPVSRNLLAAATDGLQPALIIELLADYLEEEEDGGADGATGAAGAREPAAGADPSEGDDEG